tara:strand:+ start:4772 stop:4981 length:210 start_codon:yes stop_codon:yes gene_type:complete
MKSKYIMVKNSDGLARDRRTGGIVNINRSEIDLARARKESKNKKEREFEQLKTDVSEMKELLNTIIEKL